MSGRMGMGMGLGGVMESWQDSQVASFGEQTTHHFLCQIRTGVVDDHLVLELVSTQPLVTTKEQGGYPVADPSAVQRDVDETRAVDRGLAHRTEVEFPDHVRGQLLGVELQA